MSDIIRTVKSNNIMSKGTLMKRVKQEGSDEYYDENHGEYGYPLAPGSFQTKRVQWSEKQGKFLTDLSKKELQELVEKASLRYMDGSQEGQVIESANIYDRKDPFFRHPELNMWMNMGSKDYKNTNIIDKIVLSNLRNRSEVNKPGENHSKYRDITTEMEIVDKDFDKRIQNKETEREFTVANLIKTSSYDKKVKIADVIGITVDKSMNERSLNTMIYRSIKVSPEKSEEFIENAELTNEELETKYYITKAMSKQFRIIRWTPSRNMYVMNGEHEIARKKEDVKNFLSDPENHSFLEEIIEMVDNRTKST